MTRKVVSLIHDSALNLIAKISSLMRAFPLPISVRNNKNCRHVLLKKTLIELLVAYVPVNYKFQSSIIIF